MAMPTSPIAYHRPANLAEACALGERLGEEGAFLAGGTELIPDYRRGRETARHLIALGGIGELRGIRVERLELRIGALTSVAEVARSAIVGDWLTALAEAARSLGSPQVRSVATIGGNFCRAVSCADLPPAAIVGDARLRLVSAHGEREVKAGALFLGPRQTILQRGEVLAEIVVPARAAGSGTSFQRFGQRRGMALAVASVTAGVVLSGRRITRATIVLGAVAPGPVVVTRAAEMLDGEILSDELLASIGEVCGDAARPISDIRGSAEFRRELVEVLARRALTTAVERAGRASAGSDT
jgi:aerobic carbon-monoxide dehydrogenase medium subunit